MKVDIYELMRLHEAVPDGRHGWVVWEDPDGDKVSVDLDYEMGHRFEAAGWCRDEAIYAAAAMNAVPELVAEVHRLRRQLKVERIDPLDHLTTDNWSDDCRGDGLSGGRPMHDFCDDPECLCPCHGDEVAA